MVKSYEKKAIALRVRKDIYDKLVKMASEYKPPLKISSYVEMRINEIVEDEANDI